MNSLTACIKQTQLNEFQHEKTEPQKVAAAPEKNHDAGNDLKSQPLSRYGNLVNYQVKGKEYKVKKQVSNFKQQGIASWYGPNFHKKRTSSGETYDMYQMTAAHKTLPLPCYVKVKNLENGREVVVKVNDRGPFHGDRIIDLSYAAAEKLNILANGTAKVEINIIPTAQKEAKKPSWFIQTGAFSQQALASKMAENIQRVLAENQVKILEKNQIYLVNLGPFEDKEAVSRVKEQLGSIGINESFTFLH
jgi:rare lipoprotein A